MNEDETTQLIGNHLFEIMKLVYKDFSNSLNQKPLTDCLVDLIIWLSAMVNSLKSSTKFLGEGFLKTLLEPLSESEESKYGLQKVIQTFNKTIEDIVTIKLDKKQLKEVLKYIA